MSVLNLKKFVLELLKLKINVYYFGLDGDYKQNDGSNI